MVSVLVISELARGAGGAEILLRNSAQAVIRTSDLSINRPARQPLHYQAPHNNDNNN